MLRDRSVGIWASKLIFENPRILNSAGDGLTTAGVGFNRGLAHAAAAFDAPEPVFGACGAAVLYRRRMLDEIGFLDEDFFLYDEDTDLNFCTQLAGWKCAYGPTAVAHHVVNATAKRLSDQHVYCHTRNQEAEGKVEDDSSRDQKDFCLWDLKMFQRPVLWMDSPQ
jgi:GT2 family glycosyltransferase